MNWQTLNQREKNIGIASIILLIIVVLYEFVFSPIWQQKQQLTEQLQHEQQLTDYLHQAEKKLAHSKHFALSKQQAEPHIISIFKQQKVKIDGLVMQNNQSIINIKKIEFSKLLSALQKLKNAHGIIPLEASIKRIDAGVVSANLILIFP